MPEWQEPFGHANDYRGLRVGEHLLQLQATSLGTIRNTMGHTLGTAAKATGLSRTAVLRAIKSGKISAQKNDHGEWDIDPAELHRVYPAKPDDTGNDNSIAVTPVNTDLLIENSGLKAKLEASEQRARDALDQVDDLRRRLDQADDERRRAQSQLTALLTDQRAKPEPEAPKGFWRRMFG